MGASLDETLGELFPGEVTVASRRVSSSRSRFEAENVIVSGSSAKRRAAFLSGRRCAHVAMRLGGIEPMPILVGRHREPLWPDGVVGSITHTDRIAVAVVARSTAVASLGIDAEIATRFRREAVAEYLFGAHEFRRLAEVGEAGPVIGFSGKEALFKALFPSVGRYFEFLDAEVALRIDRGTFDIWLVRDLGREFTAGSRFRGRFAYWDCHVITGICLSR